MAYSLSLSPRENGGNVHLIHNSRPLFPRKCDQNEISYNGSAQWIGIDFKIGLQFAKLKLNFNFDFGAILTRGRACTE